MSEEKYPYTTHLDIRCQALEKTVMLMVEQAGIVPTGDK
jgi:hypothetical protein